ncbi:hypothetical protein ACFL1C_02175 [Pseudomonadota bacterium]
MITKKMRLLLNLAGFAFSLVAVVFIVIKLIAYGTEVEFSLFAPLIFPLLLLSVIYGASNVLLSLAWRDLLKRFGLTIGIFSAIQIYGISLLAKYIPGNIFQFVGRQALGLSLGMPGGPLAKSSIWEIGALVFSGSLFGLLSIPVIKDVITIDLALIGFLLIVTLTLWTSYHLISRWVTQAICWYIIFLLLSGTIFWAVVSQLEPARSFSESEFLIIASAYVLAWLAGLITPGAPAGVGIREIVLYALLHSYIAEVDLLTAIVSSRIVTVFGDLFFYVFSLLSSFRKSGLFVAGKNTRFTNS